MKKFLLSFVVAVFSLASCVDYTDDFNTIDERLDALEQAVPSIEEQIESINTQLTSLKATDDAIKAHIAELEKSDKATATEIVDLKKKDSALEKSINDLQNYVDTQIANAKSEAAAAYATVEQYNAIVAQLNALQSSTDKLGEELTAKINAEVKSLTNKIADLEARLEAVEDKVENLLARIQSVSYIPTHSDGKATITNDGVTSRITLDFEISPKDAVAELAKVWDSAISVKAVYTQTRAVSFVDMPIVEFESDAESGVITVTASGENLSEEFFTDAQEASVALTISDGNSSVTSDYIPMEAYNLFPIPTFPEEQNYEILSGRTQKLLFSAEHDWTLSVDYDFAYLKDGAGNNVKSFSGAAGENIEAWVGVESAIENYDNDIVFHVNMEMAGHTSVLATLTIEKLEYAVQEYEIESGKNQRLQFRATEAWTVSMEDNDNAWLEYDSEPNYSFSGTATNELITIWVKTKEGIKNYDNDIVFSVNRKMGDAEAQEWAKFTIKKIERPETIVLNETSFETITFEKGGYPSYGPKANTDAPKYHLNYSDKWDVEGVSMSYNFDTDVAIKWYAYMDGGSNAVDFTERTDSWVTVSKFGTNNFKVVMDLTKESAEWSWWDTKYESFVTFEDEFGNVLAAIFCTCTYKSAPSTGGDTPAESIVKVSLVDASMASQIGVTLTKLEATAADYDATFGADYGVTDVPQYLLTYTQLSPLMMPQYAALNITGFSFAQVMGEYTIGDKTWYGSQVLSVWNNPDLGSVVIEPATDYGFTAETIPNGKYPIAVYNSSYSPIARIVLVVDAPTE